MATGGSGYSWRRAGSDADRAGWGCMRDVDNAKWAGYGWRTAVETDGTWRWIRIAYGGCGHSCLGCQDNRGNQVALDRLDAGSAVVGRDVFAGPHCWAPVIEPDCQ